MRLLHRERRDESCHLCEDLGAKRAGERRLGALLGRGVGRQLGEALAEDLDGDRLGRARRRGRDLAVGDRALAGVLRVTACYR